MADYTVHYRAFGAFDAGTNTFTPIGARTTFEWSTTDNQTGDGTYEAGDTISFSNGSGGFFTETYVGTYLDGFVTINSGGSYHYYSGTPLPSSDPFVVDPGPFTVCFCSGTRIATPTGPRRVEDLRAGDLVVTLSGATRPVRWIGHRRLNPRFQRDPEAVYPIVIRAGAIADGIPVRDLRVSPEHAIYFSGFLVPARFLVNGATILQESSCTSVTYYHVELDSHDILLAEGTAAESYLDTGNRSQFANAGVVSLHTDFQDGQAGRESRSCFPLMTSTEARADLWRDLSKRAVTLGFALPERPTTADAEPCLRVGERVLKPVSCNDGTLTFVVPASPEPVRLVSRSAVPSVVTPWCDDRRRLGVAVRRLQVKTTETTTCIALDRPGDWHGWWTPESDGATTWRWTDGNAVLPVERVGPCVIEVTLALSATYPLDVGEAARVRIAA